LGAASEAAPIDCQPSDLSTAIEYGLIAAGISVAIITVVNTLGSQLKATFTNISSQLATAGK
jgi:pilus assembly protein Flp/PilA